MKKITIAAPQEIKDEVLLFLQKNGCVELMDIKKALGEMEERLPLSIRDAGEKEEELKSEEEYNLIRFTYDFLKSHCTVKLSGKKQHISQEDFVNLKQESAWRGICKECRDYDTALAENKNRRMKLASQLEHYEAWSGLDVSSDELGQLKKVSYAAGTISRRYELQLYDELEKCGIDYYLTPISQRQQDINLFLICHESDVDTLLGILKKYGFSKLNLDLSERPVRRIELLQEDMDRLQQDNAMLLEKAGKLSENIPYIERIYDYISSVRDRKNTMARLVNTEKTFVAMGYVSAERADGLQKETEGKFKDSCVIIEEPEEDDQVPMLLKNNKLVEPFEAVTAMYALPTHSEVDPTPIVAPFFMLFFGMMMADVGYGILMLVVSVLFLKLKEPEGELAKLAKLAFYCSFPTIIFGVLYGSFFGGAENLIFNSSIDLTPPLWVDPVEAPMTVLIAGMVLGVIHIFTGLGIKAYCLIRDGHFIYAVTDVFSWYILIIGLISILLGSFVKNADTAAAISVAGKVMAIVGAGTILLTAGRDNKSIVGKFFGGVYSLYGITSYLGDVLSYSRLLALGLASGLIGWSFNLLIGLLGGGITAILFGPIIFLAGHTFNFLIGVLGAYVHTSRLQYLEFFGKFYEGGGRAFQPLKIKTRFIKLISQ